MNKEQNRFARETDAVSRITIYLINRANSKSIGQFGDLTHDPLHVDGGFLSGNGQVRIPGDASYVGIKPASVQYSDYILDPSIWNCVPSPRAKAILTELCERFYQVSPDQIPSLLTPLTTQIDFVFQSRAMHLDKLDFDNIHGTMTRAFVENVYPIPGWLTPLPILDHDGFFVRMNVFCNGAVFDYKTFKHQNLPGIYSFLFIPKHVGVWFNTPDALAPAGNIVLDVSIRDVLNGSSPANAGLIDAGNITSLDWAVFLGHKVFYVWRPNELQSCNTFAAALRFVAEAKKHGIEVAINRLSSFTSAAGQRLLELPAIVKQARDYGLEIPANLRFHGYVDCSLPQDIFIPRDIPVFWQNGGCTLFYGPGSTAILKNLLQAFRRIPRDEHVNVSVSHGTDTQDGVSQQYVFPKKKVGLLYPPTATTRINNLVRAAQAAIPRISSGILHEEDALETALVQNAIEALFIAYTDELLEKELAAVLDLCGRTGIAVGIFSAAEVVPSDIVMEQVSQHFAVNANNANACPVFVKDMKSKEVKKFIFGDDGKVAVVVSDEDHINNPNQ